MRFINRFLTLLFILSPILISCKEGSFPSSQESSFQQQFKVSMVDSEHCHCQNPSVMVPYGGSAQFQLEFDQGYTYANCSYANSTYSVKENGVGLLTLNRIIAPMRFRVSYKQRVAGIYYYLNGGLTNEGEESFSQEYSLSHHLRANTAFFDGTYGREGYVQIGWNREPDGSGEHIGVGSRFTIKKGDEASFYAEWAKALPEEDFDIKAKRNMASITGYHGNFDGEVFAIPETIQGKAVTSIASGVFRGIHGQKLVLPSSLKSIERRAFSDCSFSELYAYDGISSIRDADFLPMGISTLHLNSRRRPNFIGFSENAVFADNIDRLIMSMEKKRLLFFAGCSMGYGLDCSLVQSAIGAAFRPFNMGFLGGGSGKFQIDVISHFLHEGDVLVHAPEQMSEAQFFADSSAEARTFECCEGNYDLLSLVHPADYPGFYDCLGFYGKMKDQAEAKYDYEDCPGIQNEFGDFAFERNNYEGDIGFSEGEYSYDLQLAQKDVVDGLCNVYKRIEETGCQVNFSYAPMNYSNLLESQKQEEIWNLFAAELEANLNENGYQSISKVEDYLYPGSYFYDTDYHLTSEGASIRTQRLIEDLRLAGVF